MADGTSGLEGTPTKFFDKCECLANYKRLELKFLQLEKSIGVGKGEEFKKLEDKIDNLIELNKKANEEILRLSTENEDLKKRLQVSENETAKAVGMKDELDKVKHGWNTNKQEIVDFKRLVEEQKKESVESTSKLMKQAIRSNGNWVREEVEKTRCVVVFGDHEEEEKDRGKRESTRLERVVKILDKIVESPESWTNQIEEVRKIGPYKKDGKVRPNRPMRIKFSSERLVKEILSKTWRLNDQTGYKNIYVRKDLNEKEREHLFELKQEVASKNSQRTEEQEKEFFFGE